MTTNSTPTPTGTLQDLFPHLKPAAAVARHATFGQVDVMRWSANGNVTVRYLSRRAFRVFTKSVSPADLTDLIYR